MIEKTINEYLLKQQEERSKRERSGKISPSQLGRCYRYQYWNRKNEPVSNPIDVRTLRIFAVGDIFHDWVQKFFPDAKTEVMVAKDDILGFADLVTEDAVTDIKTVHSKSFWYMEKADYNINEEKKPAILQVCTYAWILEKPKANLFMVSKDDLCVAEYGFSTEKWIPEIEKELLVIRTNWTKGEFPKAEPRCYGGKECNYCPYIDKCFTMEGKPLPVKKEAVNGNTKNV